MQFITSLFGGSGNTILTMLFALGAVIVLILLAVWLLRVVFNVSGNAVRGRNRRLSVVDTLSLDQKRQLVIIRRDNVEHLILTGGPQDMLVEAGIPVEEVPAAPAPARRPLPTVPTRRQEPKPAPAPTPVVTGNPPPKAAPGTVLEQLQQAGHTGDRKTRVSLRHTGLLRPVDGQDAKPTGQNPDISGVVRDDSAKQDANRDNQSAALEHDTSNDANRG